MADNVFQAAIDILERGEQAALSTIISSKGSLPMSEKSKMLVTPEGKIIGTVGGGCLEADVWTEAREVMEAGKSRIQKFILTEKYAGESGLNCGGAWWKSSRSRCRNAARTCFAPFSASRNPGAAAHWRRFLTDHPDFPEGRRKLLLTDDGSTVGALGDAGLETFVVQRGGDLLRGENFAIESYTTASGDTLQVFLEPVLPTPTVWVFGGGHVSFFLVRAAKLAGFRAKVIDDRPAFANKERFPEADATIVMEFDQVREAFDFGHDDYVVLVTRGHQHDQHILEQIYDCGARYLGMIGSKSKIAKMWQRLEAKGIDRHYLDCVHAPVGLNIGADSPEEICISVMAEIIRERRIGKVQATRHKRSPRQTPRGRGGSRGVVGRRRNPCNWCSSKPARNRRNPPGCASSYPPAKRIRKSKAWFASPRLHTVCGRPMCPNIGECWEQRSATLMLLGDTCTRSCGFCAVRTGRPGVVDEQEPERVVETISTLRLRYAVVTSVNRDDLPDGGSHIFAAVIRGVRQHVPECRVEVLIPDFKGNWEALAEVVEAGRTS